MVTAFIDESGTHDAADRILLGAVLADARQTEVLQQHWDLILRCHGLTHLHAIDMYKRKKQFRSWHPKDIIDLIESAAELTARYSFFNIVCSLHKTDYIMHYKSRNTPKRVRLDSEYGLCLRNTISYACQRLAYSSQNNLPDLHVVIEDGHKNRGEALNIFNELQSSDFKPFCDMLKSVTFGKKQDFVGLQAADMLVYAAAQNEASEAVVDSAGIDTTDIEAKEGLVIRMPLTGGQIAEQRENLIDIHYLQKEFGRRRRKLG